jgi:glycosyltransferase involved in cell wall biosynthesis
VSPLTAGVAIPVYNGAAYIVEALESVLAQSWPVSQIAVVDDGSSDESAAVAAALGPPVQVVSQPNAGIGPARSRAAGMITADVIVLMDADDLLPPRSVEVRMAALNARPDLEMVFGHLRPFRLRGPDGEPEPIGDAVPAHIAGGLAVRRSAYERVGPFTAGLRVAEGLDWLLRAREAGVVEATLPDLIQWRRVHGTNNSMVHSGERAEFARVLKASLDRRRGRPAP